jgi:hypothetical protein
VCDAIQQRAAPGAVRLQDAAGATGLKLFHPGADFVPNMGEMQVRRLPVVDRDKRLVGVVSIGDLSGKATLAKAGDTLSRISWPASH